MINSETFRHIAGDVIREFIEESVNTNGALGKVWVTYGLGDAYDPDKFIPFNAIDPNYGVNQKDQEELYDYYTNHRNKPARGCLWASPVDSAYGWADRIQSPEYFNARFFTDKFGNGKFLFRLDQNAKVYVIDDIEDLASITKRRWSYYGGTTYFTIDYKDLINNGFDALYVTKNGYKLKSYDMIKGLESWECESLCVFNKDVIIPVDDASQGPDDSDLQWLRSLDSARLNAIDSLVYLWNGSDFENLADDDADELNRIISMFTDEELNRIEDIFGIEIPNL